MNAPATLKREFAECHQKRGISPADRTEVRKFLPRPQKGVSPVSPQNGTGLSKSKNLLAVALFGDYCDHCYQKGKFTEPTLII